MGGNGVERLVLIIWIPQQGYVRRGMRLALAGRPQGYIEEIEGLEMVVPPLEPHLEASQTASCWAVLDRQTSCARGLMVKPSGFKRFGDWKPVKEFVLLDLC